MTENQYSFLLVYSNNYSALHKTIMQETTVNRVRGNTFLTFYFILTYKLLSAVIHLSTKSFQEYIITKIFDKFFKNVSVKYVFLLLRSKQFEF